LSLVFCSCSVAFGAELVGPAGSGTQPFGTASGRARGCRIGFVPREPPAAVALTFRDQPTSAWITLLKLLTNQLE